MKNRSLAVDQSLCTQRAFRFPPKNLYCPVGEICFCRQGLQYKRNKKHCSHYEPAGNRLFTKQKRAAHQKFLNGHVIGFKTFAIYIDGGDSNTAEKH